MGIFDFLTGGPTPVGGMGAEVAGPTGGIGDMLTKAFGANANTLSMLGLGLATARTAEQQRQAIMNGYVYGSQMDANDRKEKREEDEKKRKEAELKQQAGAYASLVDNPQFAELVKNNPAAAEKLVQQWIARGNMAADNRRADESLGLSRRQVEIAERNAARPTEASAPLVERQPDGSYKTVYEPPKGNDEAARIRTREMEANRLGLKPDSPGYQSYVLTGKMPREDAQPLTATDKKAIMEAEEGAVAAQGAVESLMRAKDLNKKAYSGPLAGTRGYITSLGGNEGGAATVELDNELKSNALGQLKAIFGGAPTEGERQILMEIQGSSSLPPDVREKIYNKAIFLANRRLEINKQRAQELRGGDYYKPGGGAASVGGAPASADGAGGAPTRNPPGTGPKLLRYNPKTGALE
jgi:hypothetical protein